MHRSIFIGNVQGTIAMELAPSVARFPQNVHWSTVNSRDWA